MFLRRGQFVRMLSYTAVVAGCLAGGCVSEQVGGVNPIEQTTLTVVRTADRAQISWLSKKGQHYTVIYSDDRRHDVPWKPLPDAQNLIGTGETLTVEDQVPEGRNRYYRLHRGDFPPARSR